MYENLKNTIQNIKKIIRNNINEKLSILGFYEEEYDPKCNNEIIAESTFNMLKDLFSIDYINRRNKYVENFTFNFLNKIIALKLLLEKGINISFDELKEYIPELFDEIYDIKLDTNKIMEEINKVKDWHKEDILGWAYQYYNLDENRSKLFEQSQFYTPEWVVEYLVDNTLTKYYCEIYDDKYIAEKYKIKYEKRNINKKLEEFKILDPTCGSGHFLIKVYDRLKEFYERQGYKNYIKNIIENNIYGMDIDQRSIEIAKIILKIKALTDGYSGELDFNLVSTDFKLIKSEDIEDFKLKEVYESVKNELEGYEELGALITLSSETKNKILELQKRKIIPLFEEKTKLDKYYLDKIKKFFKILILNYDIVISNPPYTDSHDYTPNLRKFIREKYFEFRKNLYGCFIKRNYEFLIENGLLGMITPQTFMFISSYEQLRKFIIKNMHIEKLVHIGLGGVFDDALVDTAMYIFRKSKKNDEKGIYINLNDVSYNEKKFELKNIEDEIFKGKEYNKVFIENQNEFKKIPRFPFVYWINDEIKKIFHYKKLIEFADVRQGIATGDNNRFLRYHWQVPKSEIRYKKDNKKWVPYAKGGPYNKWFGNLWWVIAFDEENYNALKNMGNHLPNKKYYFKPGITYSMTTSKGPTFRILPENFLFDCKGSSIFTNDEKFKYSLIAFLNSKLAFYLYKFIAGSVDLEVGDLKYIPIANDLIKENKKRELLIKIVKLIIVIKKQNIDTSPLELHYKGSPLHQFKKGSFEERLIDIIQTKDILDTYMLLLEALVEKIIFQIYKLKKKTIQEIFKKEKVPSGWNKLIDYNLLPDIEELLKKEYLNEFGLNSEDLKEIEGEIYRFLKHIPIKKEKVNLEELNSIYYKKNRYEYDNAIERTSMNMSLNPISIINLLDYNNLNFRYYKTKEILFLMINEEYLKNMGDYNKIKESLYNLGISEEIIKKYLRRNLKDYIENKLKDDQLKYYKKTLPIFWE
ncbi:N-6 DNA methylase [Marinitoga sp. 38H-ov]|uniref:Eco57I restriction-modification methylase domain-containing protein n=1 Tax=Marinitoga sp. 38H-ov TaxID=1755814 RepID=UPI0013EB4C3B|nr:N-6 DNA methylase [Marinitoga sp. 38H-ov]KAF2956884.1 hypothetical protein AS160_03555 [Marinitoga sp. 38H-ov]